MYSKDRQKYNIIAIEIQKLTWLIKKQEKHTQTFHLVLLFPRNVPNLVPLIQVFWQPFLVYFPYFMDRHGSTSSASSSTAIYTQSKATTINDNKQMLHFSFFYRIFFWIKWENIMLVICINKNSKNKIKLLLSFSCFQKRINSRF